MTKKSKPNLLIHINFWTLLHEANPENEAGLLKQLKMIKDAGFDSYCGFPHFPNLKKHLADSGLRFGGAFDGARSEDFATQIAAILNIGNGPINCQLADHDTSVETATKLTIALMAEAKKQKARVHLEVHRDTCTETPEKAAAIIKGYQDAVGEIPLVNFDFSHPAVVKHLQPEDFVKRLFDNVAAFQQANLWHIRPFNAQHCQIPITDGKGNFSPEYEDCRPFIRQALQHWLDGPRPTNELWLVPEQGTTAGYALSCFPNIWEDTIALANDIKAMWNELTEY